MNLYLIIDYIPTKCVYDERMFAPESVLKDGHKLDSDANRTEEDYFEIMKNMNDDKDNGWNGNNLGQVWQPYYKRSSFFALELHFIYIYIYIYID